MHSDPRQLAIRISVAVSAVMLTGKVAAYLLTGSAAILSDAAESVVHGVATGFAAFSLWYSTRPADASHPYGHGRVAYLSAGFEGALVFSAALAVIGCGIDGLIRGPRLQNLGVGLTISGGLAAINLVLGTALIRIGRRHNSLILVANGKHVLSDMWTTAAAIVGVGIVLLTGLTWLDPVTAIIMGGYIMASGYGLIRKSLAGLMDELEPALAQRILACLEEQVARGVVVEFHQTRCRRVNDEIWLDVHLLVPGDLALAEAHRRATDVEQALEAALPDDRVRVNSHVEPADHETAHPGGHPERVDPLRTNP